MKKKLSIVGLGWFGMELAHALHPDYEVIGTKRKIPEENLPFEVLELDFDRESTMQNLSGAIECDCLVLNVPPNSRAENADKKYRSMIDVIIKTASQLNLQRVIFVSSTGVFGENNGSVDEFTEPIPTSVGGKVLREAEERVIECPHFEGIVLRPSGLVGGERHPVKYLAGRKEIKGRLHPVNLVHREDLISLTKALIDKKEIDGQVFHASTSKHPDKEAFYHEEAKKRGLEIPEFDISDISEGKKVLSEWSKETLGVSFNFENPYSMP